MSLKKFLKISIIVISIILAVITVCGGIFIVSVIHSEFLLGLRNIWIETAMSTFHHKWLATAFFSDEVIEEVMNKRVDTLPELSYDLPENDEPETTDLNHSKIFEEYQGLQSGDIDFAGNTIYAVNTDEAIAIVEISSDDYKGKLAIVPDPSRISIEFTSDKEIIGNNILTFVDRFDAVLAVNASGFADYNGVGDGGEIVGRSCSNGILWGDYSSEYNTVGFDHDNRLIVGVFDDWSSYNIRDAFQFNPAILVNGQKTVEGSAGWGLQPRTIIGQREDGAVLILTIDGRRPGYSLGATMEQCADELLKYDVITAAAADGGSSTIMAYNGEIITKCSSPQAGGRYLPNAIIVKKK